MIKYSLVETYMLLEKGSKRVEFINLVEQVRRIHHSQSSTKSQGVKKVKFLWNLIETNVVFSDFNSRFLLAIDEIYVAIDETDVR